MLLSEVEKEAVMKFVAKFGSFSLFLIFFVVAAWFALYFLAPLGSSQEIVSGWTWWLRGVANNWVMVLVGCMVFAAIGAIFEINEEKERDGR